MAPRLLILDDGDGRCAPQKNLNAYEELIFDIAMTMVAKAFAHLNLAIELSTATPPNFPGAGAELRHAAGLMKHLHEVRILSFGGCSRVLLRGHTS